jgi:rRNA maturation endonuclease Nob1
MSNLIEGYYHCNECDSLFESQVIGADLQDCPHCGKAVAGIAEIGPELGMDDGFLSRDDEDSLDQNLVRAGDLVSGGKTNEKQADADVDVEQTTEKEKVARQLRLISIAWISLVVSAVAVVIYFNQAGDVPSISAQAEQKNTEQIETEKQAIKLALPKCMKVIKGFINASSAAAKAQYVYNGVRLSREMEAFYATRPSFRPQLTQVRAVHYQALDIPGLYAIGTICQSDVGERFEVVFIRDGKEWKIEWKSFVRYSESDWTPFTSKANGEEAEFRLYMRVMDVGEDLADGDVLVKFYKPDVLRGRGFDGYASEGVRIPAYSVQGKVVSEMVSQEEAVDGYDHVGLKVSGFDPEHYHRVRVRMRLLKNAEQQTRLELVRIIANHWYDPAIVQATGLPEKSE